MVGRLNELLQRRNVPARIETFGSIFYLSFPSDERLASLFWFHMREKGIHIIEGFPCFLTTSHSDQDIEEIVQKFERSIVEMQEAQFLTGAYSGSRAAPGATSSESLATAPMTEAQREIFLAAMLGEDASCAFNESFNWYLRGPLEVDSLRQAVNAVIARHDALRATIDPDGTNLNLAPELRLEIPLRDLSGLDPSARDQELKRILAEDAHTAFNLTSGPLVRAELIVLEPEFHALHFTSHHIVCDGWSTNVIVDEISKLYAARADRHAVDLPPVVPFSKYAQSQLESSEIQRAFRVQIVLVGCF